MPGFSLHPEFKKEDFFEHYEDLAKNTDVILLGEMSPSNAYATLDELKWFKAEAEKKNFNVLPVMTLRDPIDQIVSATKLSENVNRMSELVTPDTTLEQIIFKTITGVIPKPKVNMTFDVVIDRISDTPFIERQVPWEVTYENFMEVFGKVHFNFYETLFTEKSMRNLCEYLQIPYTEVDYDKIVNRQGDNAKLSEEQKQFLFDDVENIQKNYTFAVEKFGKDFIESIWWTPNK